LSPAAEKPQQRHSNNHHAYPKSRIPMKHRGGKNKVFGKWLVIENVSIRAHNAFHAIFGNRTPEEQIGFLRKLCSPRGILNAEIYNDHKNIFNAVFVDARTFTEMAEILRKWDLSRATRENYAERLVLLHKVLNDKISGGIKLVKYKLN
jgi:hypothetical protein